MPIAAKDVSASKRTCVIKVVSTFQIVIHSNVQSLSVRTIINNFSPSFIFHNRHTKLEQKKKKKQQVAYI